MRRPLAISGFKWKCLKLIRVDSTCKLKVDYDAGGIAKLQQKIKKSLKYQPQEKQQRRQTSMKEKYHVLWKENEKRYLGNAKA